MTIQITIALLVAIFNTAKSGTVQDQIAAIKLVRTGPVILGLKEAKAVVDAVLDGNFKQAGEYVSIVL